MAVAARSLHKAKEFASKFDIPKAYGNYEDLGRDPNISVIYVGSICQTHLEVCKMLLNYNKHILCEKPLAMNIEETEEILKIAKEKKVFFMEAIWSRFVKSGTQQLAQCSILCFQDHSNVLEIERRIEIWLNWKSL